MRSILISIKPEWVEKILNGEKTIEIRKTAPKCDLPIDVYIYCTKSSCERLHKNKNGWFVNEMSTIFLNGVATEQEYNGKVVAKFTLRRIDDIGKYAYAFKDGFFYETLKDACLTPKDLSEYAPIKRDEWERRGIKLYAWHISDLEIFDEPKKLSDFYTLKCNQKKRPCNIKDVFGVKECHRICKLCKPLTKAPQSWCYTEEGEWKP